MCCIEMSFFFNWDAPFFKQGAYMYEQFFTCFYCVLLLVAQRYVLRPLEFFRFRYVSLKSTLCENIERSRV